MADGREPCSARFYAGRGREKGVTRSSRREGLVTARARRGGRIGGRGDGRGGGLGEGRKRRSRERTARRKKARPDNRPIPQLAENTENRESASLLSISLCRSGSLSHVRRFPGIPLVIFGPRTRFNTLHPPPRYRSSSILSSFISFLPAERFGADSCQKPADIWSRRLFPRRTVTGEGPRTPPGEGADTRGDGPVDGDEARRTVD